MDLSKKSTQINNSNTLEALDCVSRQQNLQPTCNQLATDTISRQAALKALKDIEFKLYFDKEYKMIRAARAQEVIKNLPTVSCENNTEITGYSKDTISRQAAIEHLKKRLYETELNSTEKYPYYEEIADNRIDTWMNEVPSAQPEIIRCKDCKWYGRADKRRFYRGMDCLQKRIDTIIPDKDFCSRAERRTDEV